MCKLVDRADREHATSSPVKRLGWKTPNNARRVTFEQVNERSEEWKLLRCRLVEALNPLIRQLSDDAGKLA